MSRLFVLDMKNNIVKLQAKKTITKTILSAIKYFLFFSKNDNMFSTAAFFHNRQIENFLKYWSFTLRILVLIFFLSTCPGNIYKDNYQSSSESVRKYILLIHLL